MFLTGDQRPEFQQEVAVGRIGVAGLRRQDQQARGPAALAARTPNTAAVPTGGRARGGGTLAAGAVAHSGERARVFTVSFAAGLGGRKYRYEALWHRALHFYSLNCSELLGRYHERSNVETTFSMIKAKFDTRVRAKTSAAQINEVLCKILAHNICCLIQAWCDLGIEDTRESFGAKEPVAPKALARHGFYDKACRTRRERSLPPPPRPTEDRSSLMHPSPFSARMSVGNSASPCLQLSSGHVIISGHRSPQAARLRALTARRLGVRVPLP